MNPKIDERSFDELVSAATEMAQRYLQEGFTPVLVYRPTHGNTQGTLIAVSEGSELSDGFKAVRNGRISRAMETSKVSVFVRAAARSLPILAH